MPRGVYSRDSGDGTPMAAAPELEAPAAVLPQPASRRADETRRERRRRNDGDLDRMASLKLALPQDIQERVRSEGKVVRWVLDTGLASAFQNDWDRVAGVEPIQANPREGTEEKLVLCEKYADWDAEDTLRDDRTTDAIEAQAMAGQIETDGRSSAGLHVPSRQTNRVTTQRGL